MLNVFYRKKAFTLIELLIVMGIVGVLLTMTIIAINPVAQFQAAKDVYTQSNTQQIIKALKQCYVENKGNYANCYALSPGLPTTEPPETSTSGGLPETRTTHLDGDTPKYSSTYLPILIGRWDNTLGATLNGYYYVDLCPLVTGGYLPYLPCSPSNARTCTGLSGSLGRSYDCSNSTQAYYIGGFVTMQNGLLCVTGNPGSNFSPSLYTICQ